VRLEVHDTVATEESRDRRPALSAANTLGVPGGSENNEAGAAVRDPGSFARTHDPCINEAAPTDRRERAAPRRRSETDEHDFTADATQRFERRCADRPDDDDAAERKTRK
jgi:hypothetical protein